MRGCRGLPTCAAKHANGPIGGWKQRNDHGGKLRNSVNPESTRGSWRTRHSVTTGSAVRLPLRVLRPHRYEVGCSRGVHAISINVHIEAHVEAHKSTMTPKPYDQNRHPRYETVILTPGTVDDCRRTVRVGDTGHATSPAAPASGD